MLLVGTCVLTKLHKKRQGTKKKRKDKELSFFEGGRNRPSKIQVHSVSVAKRVLSILIYNILSWNFTKGGKVHKATILRKLEIQSKKFTILHISSFLILALFENYCPSKADQK